MTRLGYRCDGCGDEYPRLDPPAVVQDADLNWLDLCAACYEQWDGTQSARFNADEVDPTTGGPVPDGGTEPAEMKGRMATLTETLAENAMARHNQHWLGRVAEYAVPWWTAVPWDDLFAHWVWLWENPDGFESAEGIERWKGSDWLAIFELGVLFGIEYEQAYPEGENSAWPVPVAERGGDGE